MIFQLKQNSTNHRQQFFSMRRYFRKLYTVSFSIEPVLDFGNGLDNFH